MGNTLTWKSVIKKHPNRFILATVALRDAINQKAKTFRVLQTARDFQGMQSLKEYYKNEGFEGVIVIPNFPDDSPEIKGYPPKLSAELFRNLYHA